jgi:outer membrane receptor protein involved in Fe transport
VTRALTLSPGVRVTGSTRLAQPAVSRWLLGEWIFRDGWSLNAATGVSQQLPELGYLRDAAGSPILRPERASYIDIGIEQRLANAVRWQATLFSRNERDILREPYIFPGIVADALTFPGQEQYSNALRGKARGIELLVDRRSPSGFSGRASYSYGKTRYTDVFRQETFWGAFDQRHSLSLFGTYRFSPRASMGATFRTGSNFPVSALVAPRDGGLFEAGTRHQLRLPPYARLDLRADRQFGYLGRRLTLFVELLNALNRANMSRAVGSVDPASGVAIGFTDMRFRRRVSAGVLVDF